MLAELELKAVVPDPEALRGRMRSAGAIAGFRGRMTDRRYDRAGELAARDEVLRIRTYHHHDGSTESLLAWKGATTRSPEGYKLRQEIELAVRSERGAAERLLGALGYAPVHVIEREVEIYRVPEPEVSDVQTATPERFPVVYPDGPHNAEAMFVVADDVFIITKDRTGRLLRGRIPTSGDRTIRLQPMADLGLPIVSDAEASPDGQGVVVRNPRSAAFYRTADLMAGKAVPYARISLEEVGEPQGEGVAFDGTRLYLTSEGRPWTVGGSFVTLHCALDHTSPPRV